MALLSSSVSGKITSLCISSPSLFLARTHAKRSPFLASLNASSSPESTSAPKAETFSVSAKGSSQNAAFAANSNAPELPYSSDLSNPNGNPFVRFVQSTESTIERVIFDFRFLALLAIGGSLAGSLLCFLNGCVYIFDAYKVYWSSCVKGIHTGKMVLRLVEAIDVYLAGTVMLIFGMGLYGLFISNVPPNVPPSIDRALKGSSLFGMFALKERPKWMKISSLDELKTKVGHVIVMILLVKMFERSKMVTITTGVDLLSYSVCIFLSSASLYILHNLHKSESD
ncbi:Uncharacterised protein family (UPF0114 [Striga hermonthica]|uniref:Structural constituent of ribosome n=1 Tax=Striga hermonthica TaxID=68872 RepID=A0A9N7N488_STRHE|nr:Uncharacterised protein family (UPF0114 [Striga hermonthica]